MDVSTAFLNNHLDEPIYMIPPPGFLPPQSKVKCSLYGLCQSPRQWYGKIDSDLIKWGFTCTIANSNVCSYIDNDNIIILVLYVDDLYITGSNTIGITRLKQYLTFNYIMTNLGMLTKFLGVQFEQRHNNIFLHQILYVVSLRTEYGMLDMPSTSVPMPESTWLQKDMATPLIDAEQYQRLIGKLNHLTKTRWDIGFVVSLFS